MSAPVTFRMRLPVERGKASEFCRAVGLVAEDGADHAPPTFTAVMDHHGPTIAAMMAALGYPAHRVLHGEESIDLRPGALRLGQSLSGEARHVGTDRVDGRSGPLELVRFAVELRDGDGEVVVQIERTLVVLAERSGASGGVRAT